MGPCDMCIKIRQSNIKNFKDANLILEFFNRVLPQYRRDLRWLQWTYSKNDIMVIAVDKDHVVGFYGIVKSKLKIMNKTFLIGKGINALVDPNYKKKISIMDITKVSYDIAKTLGIKMLIGFPNNNYHLIQEKIERWDVVSRFNSLNFKNPRVVIPSNLQLHPIIDENGLEESLKKVYEPDFSVIPLTDWCHKYLNCPSKSFNMYKICKNDQICGVFSLKVYTKHIGHIIDFKLSSDLKYSELIQCCLYMLKCDSVTVFPVNTSFNKELVKFKPNTDFNVNFLVKFLDHEFSIKYKPLLLDVENWNLNMGVSDAF